MADKEIIIDDVDVSRCCWCDFEPDTEPYCSINDGEDLTCKDNPDCYFKQLKRKEQECKNLEEELRGCRIGIKDISIENTEICKIPEKYKQALDEIEEFCTVYSDNHDAYETVYKFILIIINKVKDKQ